MELTDVQKQALVQWVGEGLGLSDIQKRLSEEFNVSMKYMDVRFLVLDLDLSLRDKPDPKPTPDPVEPNDAATGDPASSSGQGPRRVSVEINRVQQPGTLVSGSVVFSDGVRALWAFDAQRRFMLEPDQEGYQPSEADLQAFQMELQTVMGGRGV